MGNRYGAGQEIGHGRKKEKRDKACVSSIWTEQSGLRMKTAYALVDPAMSLISNCLILLSVFTCVIGVIITHGVKFVHTFYSILFVLEKKK